MTHIAMADSPPLRKALGGRPGFLGRLLLFCLVIAPPIFGQTEPPPASAALSVDVNLVVLHATVQDRKGGFVSGLSQVNFRVFEDGVPQTIRTFQHADVPVAIGLIVDNSRSMRRKKQDVTAAALAFVRSSNPQDQIFVVNFNEHVLFGLPAAQPFSASVLALEAALNGALPDGMTALYDAIDAGIEHLKRTTLDRKALIVISDGGDNASHRTVANVLESAARSNDVIYTIGLSYEDDADSNPAILRKVARATGGECYLPQDSREIVPICRRIAEDIRHQYTIAYAPSNQEWDNRYRTIRVTASLPHREKLVVRTRAGYVASPSRLP